MSVLFPGTAYLSAHAILEHPRVLPGRQVFIIFDAIIYCSYPRIGTHICCSLCYTLPDATEPVHSGVYHVHATVNNIGSLAPRSPFDEHTQVASFQSHIHEPSPCRRNSQFALIGNILDVVIFAPPPSYYANQQ